MAAINTICARVGPPELTPIRGIVFNAAEQTFVAIFQYRTKRAPFAGHGFYYATSNDLVEWSRPKLLLQIDLRNDASPGESWAAYPSIIDSTSTDRNFSSIETSADLVFVRILTDPTTKRITRRLVAVRLAVEITDRRSKASWRCFPFVCQAGGNVRPK